MPVLILFHCKILYEHGKNNNIGAIMSERKCPTCGGNTEITNSKLGTSYKSIDQKIISQLKAENENLKDDEALYQSMIKEKDDKLAAVEKILSELNNDLKKAEHTYIGRESVFHVKVKGLLGC